MFRTIFVWLTACVSVVTPLINHMNYQSKLHHISSSRINMADSVHQERYSNWFKEREQKVKGISLQEATYTIRSLGDMLCDGDLNLCPKYQRGYVWKKERAARLIETVLGNRFIPPIILHEQNDGRYDVIDGKQRLATILSFWFGESDANKFELPLTAVHLQPESSDDGDVDPLKGLSFQDLPEPARKRYINFKVSVKVVSRDCDEELVYEMYEDINSGADDLNAQQLRRAVFHSPYMDMIDRLRENKNLLALRGATSIDQFELDGEMILRALAFTNTPLSEFKGPLKKFLNRDAGHMRDVVMADPSVITTIEKEFELIVNAMLIVFGADKACREWVEEKWADKYSLWLWDGLYVVLKELLISNNANGNDNNTYQVTLSSLQNNSEAIIQKIKERFEDESFAVAKKSSKAEMSRRHEILREIFTVAKVTTASTTEIPEQKEISNSSTGNSNKRKVYTKK